MQAIIAEYLATTLFLFITIGVIGSGCHTANIAADSKNVNSLSQGNSPPIGCRALCNA